MSILNLPWEDFNSEICKDLGAIDKVIAADIVYDTDLFESLMNAIKCLKDYCGVEEFIFSCTERNSETLDEFLTLMSKSLFVNIYNLFKNFEENIFFMVAIQFFFLACLH